MTQLFIAHPGGDGVKLLKWRDKLILAWKLLYGNGL
jgi:hypothetical protein